MRNLKKSSSFFLILAIIILISSNVYALPSPNHEFYVYDSVGILDNATENYIINTNIELHDKTGAQIVWATINDLEGMDINTYATALFDEWNIGGRELDNGLLVLIVPEDGEIWIEVGYGLEGVLTAGRVKRIIENSIIPNFSQGDFNAGVLLGYEEILDYVESEYNIELSTRDANYNPSPTYDEREFRPPNIFLIIGLIIFLIIDFKFFRGWLTFSLIRSIGRGGHRGGGGSRGGRGGGGRSGGGGAGGRW